MLEIFIKNKTEFSPTSIKSSIVYYKCQNPYALTFVEKKFHLEPIADLPPWNSWIKYISIIVPIYGKTLQNILCDKVFFFIKVLKNPEREKDQKEQQQPPPSSTKPKDCFVSSKFSKEKERPKKEWERIRPKDRPKIEKTTYTSREKDRSRRDRSDYKTDRQTDYK